MVRPSLAAFRSSIFTMSVVFLPVTNLQLVEQNQAASLEELLKLGMPIDLIEPASGDSLLTRAAYCGNKATIEMLVKANADLGHTNVRIISPTACRIKNVILARRLDLKLSAFLWVQFVHRQSN